MSLPIIIILMLVAGYIGGLINFYLPANIDGNGNRIRTQMICIIIGIGAAILMPLFLELAQSKLMDNIHLGFDLQKKECDCSNQLRDTLNLNVTLNDTTKRDSAALQKSPAVIKAQVPVSSVANVSANCCVPLKSYFLFLAYCFLAAAAGVRFITSIIDSVLKEKQIEKEKLKATIAEKEKDVAVDEKLRAEEEKLKAEKDKEEADKAKLKWIMNSRMAAKKSETEAMDISRMNFIDTPINILPQIGPVTVLDDPQKGRFGGKAIKNDRQLKATVDKSLVPGFYNVKIWVETTNPDRPLTDDVIFYIHDSFNPSVYTIKSIEFKDGKAMDDTITAFGAFTVGAIADQGQTLLELDLADQPEFPKEFRER